jgi:hypothetical protein
MADDAGATDGHEPLAKLTASPHFIELSGTRGHYLIPRGQVVKVSGGKLYPWFFAAVQIHHQAPGLPRELQFKSLELKHRELLRQLAELGYPLS